VLCSCVPVVTSWPCDADTPRAMPSKPEVIWKRPTVNPSVGQQHGPATTVRVSNQCTAHRRQDRRIKSRRRQSPRSPRLYWLESRCLVTRIASAQATGREPHSEVNHRCRRTYPELYRSRARHVHCVRFEVLTAVTMKNVVF
jgi:hypothetical protein